MLSPGLERYSATVLAHFEISPAFDPFIEARYVNVTANQEGQPTFFNNAFRIDNPFLNATDRTTLSNLILNSGCNPSLTVTCPAAGNLSAADRAAIAAGTYRFILAKNLLDVGLRDEKFRRDTYRAVLGVRAP